MPAFPHSRIPAFLTPPCTFPMLAAYLRTRVCPQESTDLMRFARHAPSRLATASTLVGLILAAAPLAAQGFHVERLRTEYAVNPIGIDETAPRMSWMLHADRRGTRQ